MNLAFAQYVRVVACLTWCPPKDPEKVSKAEAFRHSHGYQAGDVIRPMFATGAAYSVAQLRVLLPHLPKSTIRNILATDSNPSVPDSRRLVRVEGTAAYRRAVL